MVNFEISGFDYVGLILKIDHYFQGSNTDNFWFLPVMRGRSKNLRTLSFLRIRFSLTSYLDQTVIPRFDRYRCFSDYFRFNGHFRLHGTILIRPMTQFNSLAITFKRNQADSLQSLGPNFRKKSDPLKIRYNGKNGLYHRTAPSVHRMKKCLTHFLYSSLHYSQD